MTSENRQGTHHYILTLQVRGPMGVTVRSCAGTCTPPAGSTRHDAYLWLRGQVARDLPDVADGSIVYFELTPNQI